MFIQMYVGMSPVYLNVCGYVQPFISEDTMCYIYFISLNSVTDQAVSVRVNVNP